PAVTPPPPSSSSAATRRRPGTRSAGPASAWAGGWGPSGPASREAGVAPAGTTGVEVRVPGFCMGGGLALVVACQQGDAIGACVPWYGLIPWPDAQPDSDA